MPLSLITVNLGAPSLERAARQLRWLAARPEDVMVLTETKSTAGSRLLAEAFTAAGYAVIFPDHEPGELGVMIVSRLAVRPDPLNAALDYLPARAAGVIIDTTAGPLRIVGAYVPSRDATQQKTQRKKAWINQFCQALEATSRSTGHIPMLLLGDLNVLEPAHTPAHHGQFAPFEYAFYTRLTVEHGLLDLYRYLYPDRVEHSWARRPDLGYRYDHVHGSRALAVRVTGCDYVHETRQVDADGARLTDHSGLAVELSLTPTTTLLASDPTQTPPAMQVEREPTLF